MKIRIGHPAYTGRNAMKWHETYGAALRDLLQRGIKMAEAQRALSLAKKNPGAVADTEHEFRGATSGKVYTEFACEVMFQ